MKVRRIWWLMGYAAVAVFPAAAQESRQSIQASVDRAPTFVAEKRERTSAAFETAPAARDLDLQFLPNLPVLTRIERQRTPFSAEARLPLAGLWGGRLQLACVHQRYRALNSAQPPSTRYQMFGLEAPGTALSRSRANFGVTLSFHFGRRGVTKTTTLFAQER